MTSNAQGTGETTPNTFASEQESRKKLIDKRMLVVFDCLLENIVDLSDEERAYAVEEIQKIIDHLTRPAPSRHPLSLEL